MIKKFTLIFIFIVASQLFINCSNDNDGMIGPDPTSEITGTWDLVSSEIDGTYSATIGGLPISADITGEAYDIDLTVTITETPNKVSSVGDYSLELTMTLNGISETENQENINAFETADWTLDGDELTIAIAGSQSIVYDVVEVTSSSLILKTTLEELLEEDGALISIVLNETMEFSR